MFRVQGVYRVDIGFKDNGESTGKGTGASREDRDCIGIT